MANQTIQSGQPPIDLPKKVGSLFDFVLDEIPVSGPAAAPQAGLNPQGFAEGGLVDAAAGGVPTIDTGVAPQGGAGLAVPAGAPGAPGAGADIEAEAKRIMREQPQMAAQMLEAAEDGIEMGEFTEEMINVGGKMAIVVSRNPDMYPKMVQRLTAMGAKDIPEQFDPEFVMVVILMYLAWKDKDSIKAGGMASGGAPAAGKPAAAEIQNFRDGGYVTHGSNAKAGGEVDGAGGPTDDMININVSDGEVVIPAIAVKEFGVKHFLSKYVDPYKGRTVG